MSASEGRLTEAEVDRVARLLIAEWERVDGPVNVSRVANFADMARAVVDLIAAARAEALAPVLALADELAEEAAEHSEQMSEFEDGYTVGMNDSAQRLRAAVADHEAVERHNREQQAQALEDAADLLDSRRSMKGIASRALDPGVAMAVATFRDCAAYLRAGEQP